MTLFKKRVTLFYQNIILGDENIPLDESECSSSNCSYNTENSSNSSSRQRNKYTNQYIPIRCQPIGNSPAVKLTFDKDITIGQFKAIEVSLGFLKK